MTNSCYSIPGFALGKFCRVGRKVWLGTFKGGPAVGYYKKGSASMYGSRFRETHFFCRKKIKQKTTRLRLMLESFH